MEQSLGFHIQICRRLTLQNLPTFLPFHSNLCVFFILFFTSFTFSFSFFLFLFSIIPSATFQFQIKYETYNTISPDIWCRQFYSRLTLIRSKTKIQTYESSSTTVAGWLITRTNSIRENGRAEPLVRRATELQNKRIELLLIQPYSLFSRMTRTIQEIYIFPSLLYIFFLFHISLFSFFFFLH